MAAPDRSDSIIRRLEVHDRSAWLSKNEEYQLFLYTTPLFNGLQSFVQIDSAELERYASLSRATKLGSVPQGHAKPLQVIPKLKLGRLPGFECCDNVTIVHL